MERVRGDITSPNDEVILEDVDIHLHETRRRGIIGWRGSFSVPGSGGIRIGMHHLALEDGREASILVNNITSRIDGAGKRTTINFFVSGLLAQPAN